MKKLALLSIFSFFSIIAFSQVGLTARYQVQNGLKWLPPSSSSNSEAVVFAENGYSVGVDYWFRLKNYRIEFLPEVNYAWFSEQPAGGPDIRYKYLSLFLNTNIYFLDLEGDCDCPTFSKDGSLVSKGLFLQVSPGISAFNTEIKYSESADKIELWSPSIGLALGLDLGVSDILTISPMFGGRFFFNTDRSSLTGYSFVTDEGVYTYAEEQDTLFHWFAGLRLGLRFDDY